MQTLHTTLIALLLIGCGFNSSVASSADAGLTEDAGYLMGTDDPEVQGWATPATCALQYALEVDGTDYGANVSKVADNDFDCVKVVEPSVGTMGDDMVITIEGTRYHEQFESAYRLRGIVQLWPDIDAPGRYIVSKGQSSGI